MCDPPHLAEMPRLRGAVQQRDGGTRMLFRSTSATSKNWSTSCPCKRRSLGGLFAELAVKRQGLRQEQFLCSLHPRFLEQRVGLHHIEAVIEWLMKPRCRASIANSRMRSADMTPPHRDTVPASVTRRSTRWKRILHAFFAMKCR
jgi:hypothetical protein